MRPQATCPRGGRIPHLNTPSTMEGSEEQGHPPLGTRPWAPALGHPPLDIVLQRKVQVNRPCSSFSDYLHSPNAKWSFAAPPAPHLPCKHAGGAAKDHFETPILQASTTHSRYGDSRKKAHTTVRAFRQLQTNYFHQIKKGVCASLWRRPPKTSKHAKN